jgi:hypothetical protein
MIDADLVFLDVANDGYVCLPDAAAEVRLANDRRSVSVSTTCLTEDLRLSGLIREIGAAEPALASHLPARPIASALPFNPGRGQWRDLPQLTRATLDIAVAYRGRPFARLLQEAREIRRSGRSVDATTTLLEVIERFHRWIPYAPVSGKCLLRSFMLLRLLQRAGHDAQWVFGVATWPFRAHCWLQCGEMVLDDTVERLVPFHPILAV